MESSVVSVGVQCAPKQLQAQLSPSDVQAFFNRTKRTLEEGSQPKGWVGELRPNQILRLKLPLVDPKKITNLSLYKVWESFTTTFLGPI